MAGTVNVGDNKLNLGDAPSRDYHGTDFHLLLESLNAGQSFTDLDATGRAHLLGLIQGLELGRHLQLIGWDLKAPFFTLDYWNAVNKAME